MSNSSKREDICRFLDLHISDTPVTFDIQTTDPEDGYTRHRIVYHAADNDEIPAYLLVPDGDGSFPAALILHQHAGQRHLGKSEVVGIAGNPLQAFAPTLARRGMMVLVPDSICFEDRRKHTDGYDPDERDSMAHFIEMGRRLTLGDTLMRKVLSDATVGLSLLKYHPDVDATRVGVIGHSYGGSTALFLSALDTRPQFVICSGALGSYAYKHAHDVGLEMSLLIPGFAAQWDAQDLLDCIAPRPILILSADEDPYSADAPQVIAQCQSSDHIVHQRYEGPHALTPQRFDVIIDFAIQQMNAT